MRKQKPTRLLNFTSSLATPVLLLWHYRIAGNQIWRVILWYCFTALNECSFSCMPFYTRRSGTLYRTVTETEFSAAAAAASGNYLRRTWTLSAVWDAVWRCATIITGRMPRSGKLPVLFLLTGQKSGFSPRRGDTLHRFRSNFAVPTATWVRLAGQNFTLIGADGWECGPKISKISTYW